MPRRGHLKTTRLGKQRDAEVRERRRHAWSLTSLQLVCRAALAFGLLLALGVVLIPASIANHDRQLHAAPHAVEENLSVKSAEHEVSIKYTVPSRNLALLLTQDGFLHAYGLEHGNHEWSADVGGAMLSVAVETPPSEEAVRRDPLALPFLVRGNRLFTRLPLWPDHDPRNPVDPTDLLEEIPPFLRSHFFMNISTLLRRQTVFVAGTDVYVTTSVEVDDLDSHTGKRVKAQDLQPRSARGRGDQDDTWHNSTASAAFRGVEISALLPILHMVRYNIVLHVVKMGEFHWSITLSQLRLSTRAAVHCFQPSRHSSGERTGSASTESDEAGSEETCEQSPRFFSQFMRSLLDYDDEHAAGLVRHPAETERMMSSQVGGTTPVVWKKGEAFPTTMAEKAESLSRIIGVQQLSSSHVCLRSFRDGTIAWRAALPSTANAPPVGSSDRGLDTDGAKSAVIASYVQVSGVADIHRIPVWGPGMAVRGNGTESEVVVNMGGKGKDAAAGLTLLLTSASFTEAVSSTSENASGRLQLWQFDEKHDGVVIPAGGYHEPQGSYGWVVEDVDADEREETELEEFYRRYSWWESSFFFSTPACQQTDEGNSATALCVGPLESAQKSPSPAHQSASSYSTGRLLGGPQTTTEALRSGLPWRTAAVISFNVLCLAGSIAFLCAGVPPRGQLQRAWAQADRNRDRLMHPSASHPPSVQMLPQDHLLQREGRSTPFSLSAESISTTAMGPCSTSGGLLAGAGVSLSHPLDYPLEHVDGARASRVEEGPVTPSPSLWEGPTTEQVYAMMREENNDVVLPPSAGISYAGDTISLDTGAGLTTSSFTKQLKRRAGVANGVAASSSLAVTPVSDMALMQRPDRETPPNSSDEDSLDIDLGERWWVRAQVKRPLPSATVLDDAPSELGSSASGSHARAGTGEEGKLFQQHFKVLGKVGFGGEGCVFCVEHRVTSVRYAMKAIQIHEKDEQRVVQEAVLHSSFDHANVVRFFFCWIEDIAVSTADRLQLCNTVEDGFDTASLPLSDNSIMASSMDRDGPRTTSCGSTMGSLSDDKEDMYHMLFIQMEYFPAGTLADWLRCRTGFFRLEVLQYMKQIAEGLAYLHTQGVVHRDLKPTNIFVSTANVLKIGDFGLAKRRDNVAGSATDLASNVVGGQQERSVVGGSPLYCSPEQMRGDAVNKPTDVFSLGIVAVEMLCVFSTLHERISVLTDARHQQFPSEVESCFPDELRIIRLMLAAEPSRRPTIQKVLRQVRHLIATVEAEQDTEEEAAAELIRSPIELPGDLRSPLGSPVAFSPAVTAAQASDRNSAKTNGTVGNAPSPMVTGVPQLSVGFLGPRSQSGSSTVHPSAETSDAASSTVAVESLVDSGALISWQRDGGGPRKSRGAPVIAKFASSSQQLPESGQSSSPAGTDPSRVVKHSNVYLDRFSGSISLKRVVEAGSSPIVELQPWVPLSSQESFVTDPYGKPATPVMYAGDADLSTILRRDLQDRIIPGPD